MKGIYCVVQAGQELGLFLHQLPESWDSMHVSPHMAGPERFWVTEKITEYRFCWAAEVYLGTY